MNELTESWLKARETFLALGDFGPGLVLCAIAVGLEIVSDRFVAPWLAPTRPKMAGALTAGFDGLRAGIVTALPFGFTLDLEFLVLGGLAGLATKLVKLYLASLDGPHDEPPGGAGATVATTLLLAALALSGCTQFSRPELDCLAVAEADSAARFARTCAVIAVRCEALYQSIPANCDGCAERVETLGCANEYRDCSKDSKDDDKAQEEKCLD